MEDFREATRACRMSIATEAEDRFHRTVSWGEDVDGRISPFTTFPTPRMTRPRFHERAVLDALISSGIARPQRGADLVREVGESRAKPIGWRTCAMPSSACSATDRPTRSGGVVLSADGYMATSPHVVSDGRECDLEVVGTL